MPSPGQQAGKPAKQNSRGIWRSPGDKHQRRIELMVLIGCAFLIVAGAGWAILFALRAQWLDVPMELWLMGRGIVGVVMTRRQNAHAAGMLGLGPLFITLIGT